MQPTVALASAEDLHHHSHDLHRARPLYALRVSRLCRKGQAVTMQDVSGRQRLVKRQGAIAAVCRIMHRWMSFEGQMAPDLMPATRANAQAKQAQGESVKLRERE